MDSALTSNMQITRMISSLGELPSSPKIVTAVMEMTSDPDSDIRHVEKLISADQAMSARLLRLSNSSFYGQRKTVATLHQAIIIIGFYTLRSLVVAASVHSMYKNKDDNSVEKKLWEHSLTTALACRKIAQKLGHHHLEEIFMAGLLHDIGKLVMNQKMAKNYENLCTKVENEQLNFIDVEKSEFGFSHCEVGSLLMSKWNLPSGLSNAVFLHHNPDQDNSRDISDYQLYEIPIEYILQFGNHLAKRTGLGFNDYKIEDLGALPLARILKLTDDDYAQMTTELEAEFEEELQLFEG